MAQLGGEKGLSYCMNWFRPVSLNVKHLFRREVGPAQTYFKADWHGKVWLQASLPP